MLHDWRWANCLVALKDQAMIFNENEGFLRVPEASERPLNLDEKQFAFFQKCYPKPPALASGGKVEGKEPRSWYAGAPEQRPAADLQKFGNGVNRSQLIAMRADSAIPSLDLCIAILAWGGMHGSNRNHLFKRDVSHWLAVAERVRFGDLTRQQAFDAFASLNLAGTLVGMGPAYYTKLIYFLMPRSVDHPVGYIMDQWLGCSVNLICGQEVVRMDSSVSWVSNKNHVVQQAHSRVSPLNTGLNYERFCQTVELVAQRLAADWTADVAELALMSTGGKTPAPWRRHVVRDRLRRLAPSL